MRTIIPGVYLNNGLQFDHCDSLLQLIIIFHEQQLMQVNMRCMYHQVLVDAIIMT